MWPFERHITHKVTPRDDRNNYGHTTHKSYPKRRKKQLETSVLVQRNDHTVKACAKDSFSPDGASVLGFSPYMRIPCSQVIGHDQPPVLAV